MPGARPSSPSPNTPPGLIYVSDDMPGLAEAVAIILEEIEDGGAADSLIAEIAGKKAYRIIAKAVREQVAAEIDARGLACDSFGGYEELIYRNAARIARGDGQPS